ncbi:hypothetical protein MWU63_20245 [Pseudohalocynthiibacter sp. F2068]|jgi:GIY-YIG catalytic domain|nr:hypothetical protein [Pseudohalocynthiibacter sp. F2068]
MTYSLSSTANDLVSPKQLFIPTDTISHIKKNEISHGIYGWWFDDVLLEVSRNSCKEQDGRHLLYVGISPSRKRLNGRTSPQYFQKRLGNHIQGKIGTSTLRFSLASLLVSEFGFQGFRNSRNRPKMRVEDEARLSQWLAKHGRLSFCSHEEPWRVEHELLNHGPRLPLNILGSSDPFTVVLKSLRQNWGRN